MDWVWKKILLFSGNCDQSIWDKSRNLNNSYFVIYIRFLPPLQNRLFWENNGRRAWVPCNSKTAVKRSTLQRFLKILWPVIVKISLREKCPNTEFFLARIFRIRSEYGEILRISPYSVRMREDRDQKKLRIWTLFTQCMFNSLGLSHYFFIH